VELIEGEGTPESQWQAWSRDWPPFSLAGCRRLVVVAPHPDDEVLGVGGTMALAVAAGVQVQVVAVTDGGASHPGSPTLSPDELVALRPGESEAALAQLGVVRAPLRLRLPDGAVAQGEDDLAAALEPVLRGPGTWALTTWRQDGHPDHEATGRATAAACGRTGARLVEFPVWTWHWAGPDDARVPWSRAASVLLPPEVQAAKRRAVDCFATQVRPLSDHPADAPVLPPPVLARLLRPTETVFE
jgi:LmbE family N-acetylglucosaminyl deacetylase